MARRAPIALPLVTLLLLAALAVPAWGRDGNGRYHEALDPAVFPVPDVLRPNIDFWVDIFSRFSSDQVVLHDEWHLDVVYGVVDLSDLRELPEVQQERMRRDRVDALRDEIKGILRSLGGSGATVQAPAHEVERIRQLWQSYPGGRNKYIQAASRVRAQRGLSDRFAEAIRISGMFMPGIEVALAEEGVPREIRCLPFVESMFNHKARSKVGASGAWQFTRSTGRLFLNIDAAVDERSDVLIAAHGASRLLKKNYEKLGTWPLALTAYNHGTAGIARAVQRTGTRDIGRIATTYSSRSFGFASRNFYAEFLAAVVVYWDRSKYFPGVEPYPELRFDVFETPLFVSMPHLATESGLSVDQLTDLNPALSREVVRGDLLIPRGYPLRVPEGRFGDVAAAYERLGEELKKARQTATSYRVQRGDTLGSIARRFGTSVSALQAANNLPRADRIYVGQDLVIPGQHRAAAAVARVEVPSEGVSHVVAPGETLSRIASRYGTTPARLAAANGLHDPDRLAVGQRLRISGSGTGAGEDPGAVQHVVRRGDTLFQIAVSYGSSVDAIRSLNRLTSNVIRIGQVLLIPVQ